MNSGLIQDRETPRRRNERVSIISTNDACEHAASLRDWSQDYLQLSQGAFEGEIIEATVGPMQVFKETIRQSVDEKASPRCDSYTIGVPASVTPNGYWQGRHLERDSLITLCPNEELHFRTPMESTILVTVIDCNAFDSFAQDSAAVDVLPLISKSHAAALPGDAAQTYRVMLETVLSSVASTPEIFEHSASAQSVAETVMNASLNALRARSQETESPRTSHSVQRAIVERARSYVIANRENPPTVAELSSYLKMSRRGLHHAFINVLGINITTFLRYVRLHGVRKELLRATPEDSISGIACKWGFWHMGMFSSYYKCLFGETPSSTLRRTSNFSKVASRRHH
ncbi:helix-turn-helix domain-containing protein [Aromatoleum petrolei]|uniref:Helix-turn-helix domain-containing protein n=1 Tax=Aromatoleum petrolei TaxID=76116 RepID=A0ABX1MRQ4_9RHOO|nr:helix-turn-helix domain-containing protein [Aromatoleum petrolei]NMF89006.1 helix-turn-helix domain-containing protein [Aromatoleum petrolei]QTQ34366.1 Putative transcriptional regulator, AraC family [Aromatoleum petrolei]